jgi:hypothetical protein
VRASGIVASVPATSNRRGLDLFGNGGCSNEGASSRIHLLEIASHGSLAKSVNGDPAALRFTIDGVPFKPFFETYGRHSAYLHVTLR